MTTRYVRKDGDDTTGDGTTELPYLTVKKGLSVSVAGDTLMIGDGVYNENSGSNYLLIQKNLADFLIIQGENGLASDVTITGTTSAQYSVRCDQCSHLHFKYIKFAWNVDPTGGFGPLHINGTPAEYIYFTSCTFTQRLKAATITYGFYSNNASYLQFDHCTFLSEGTPGTNSSAGFRVENVAVNHITIQDCSFDTYDQCCWIADCTSFSISRCSFASSNSYGLIIGLDGSTGNAVTGTIEDCSIAGAAHALLIGSNATNVSVSRCAIVGNGQSACVFKECTGCSITQCSISGGLDGNTLYFKGCTSITATYNTIIHDQAVLVKAGINSTTSRKVLSITFTNNIVIGTGSAALLSWGDDTEDAGGCVVNNNHYLPAGSGKFGSVRASAAVATLADLRSAWLDYEDGINDANSNRIASPRRAYVH